MRINRGRRLTAREQVDELRKAMEPLIDWMAAKLSEDYDEGWRRGFTVGQAAGARQILNTIAPDPKIRAWGRWAQEYPRPRYELPDPPETPPAT